MRLISVIYDEFLNNFQIQHPVHIAKFSPSPTGPWSLQETGKTLYRYFQLNYWTGILHLSLGLPTDFLELLSATWETKPLDIDGSWKEGTKYLEKESLEAEFGEAVPWAGISLSLN